MPQLRTANSKFIVEVTWLLGPLVDHGWPVLRGMESNFPIGNSAFILILVEGHPKIILSLSIQDILLIRLLMGYNVL